MKPTGPICLLLVTLLTAPARGQTGLPVLPEIPVTLPDDVRPPLIAKREPLAQRKVALIDEGLVLNKSCVKVEKGSSQHQRCLAQQKQFNEGVRVLRLDMSELADEIDAAVSTHIIKSMNALAKRLGWTAAEQARLDKALTNLASDGDPDVTDDDIVSAWDDILARGQAGDFAREAAQGDGPGIPGAGTQMNFKDCTIFALANAAGLPYGVAAARATKLIGEGAWRDASERANPQKVIEQKGLIVGEVIMLAEAFGRAEVVPSSAFAKTLKEGRPVMVSVVAEDGDVDAGHQVVLTKAFQHGGATWYELMDSNQGPVRRLYLSARELDILLQQNGVAVRPEPGTTPALLR
jgi:hypothetical protein